MGALSPYCILMNFKRIIMFFCKSHSVRDAVRWGHCQFYQYFIPNGIFLRQFEIHPRKKKFHHCIKKSRIFAAEKNLKI